MKITLTEKFSKEKAGQSIELSEKTAQDLIKEGKAIEGGSKSKAKGKKADELETPEEAQMPQAPEAESNEIVIE
jgi:hypothetical protein